MSVPIGCHVSPGGKNVRAALAEAQARQMTAMQVFSSGRINRQNTWPSPEDTAAFVADSAGMYKAVHAAYVLNPCAPPTDVLSGQSIAYLIEALQWAESLAMHSVVVHPSSAKDNDPAQARAWATAAMTQIRESYQGPVQLLLENSAGDKADRLVGREMEHLAEIIEAADLDDWLGICFDTTHGFAAGYDLSQMAALPAAYPQIALVHFNVPAPAVELGNRKDRHGVFEETAWALPDAAELAVALAKAGLPLIMETKHAHDIDVLRGWLADAGISA